MAQKFFKLSSIGFYLLMIVLFFLVGLYVAKLSGAGKNQMLAGGAIVMMWGLLFAFGAFITSFFVVRLVSLKTVIQLNWILLILILSLYGYGYYRLSIREKKASTEIHEPSKTRIPSPTPENLY